jgi:hypothetical protein
MNDPSIIIMVYKLKNPVAGRCSTIPKPFTQWVGAFFL